MFSSLKIISKMAPLLRNAIRPLKNILIRSAKLRPTRRQTPRLSFDSATRGGQFY